MFEFKAARDTFADSIEAAARPYCEEILCGINAAAKSGQFVFCYECDKMTTMIAKYIIATLGVFGYTASFSEAGCSWHEEMQEKHKVIYIYWSTAGGY